MLDYHLHLWPHSQSDAETTIEQVAAYCERAVAAGVDAKLDVWEGMPHGFPGGIGNFNAAAQALDAIGAFLMERLATNEI